MCLRLGDIPPSDLAVALNQVLGNRAADHRPQGEVDFDSDDHLAFPSFQAIAARRELIFRPRMGPYRGVAPHGAHIGGRCSPKSTTFGRFPEPKISGIMGE